MKKIILILWVILTTVACQKDCTTGDCMNGGTCNLGICDCPEGYAGEYCENEPLCNTIDCLNGGTCELGICQCPPEYVGQYCELDNPCNDVICENGGVCIAGICECIVGSYGTLCENLVTPNQVLLKDITVLKFPPGGDPAGNLNIANVDLYVKISQNGIVLHTSSICRNIEHGEEHLAESIDLVITGSDLNSLFRIALYDSDVIGNDDFLSSIEFVPIDLFYDFFPNVEQTVISTANTELTIYTIWTF